MRLWASAMKTNLELQERTGLHLNQSESHASIIKTRALPSGAKDSIFCSSVYEKKENLDVYLHFRPIFQIITL